MKINQPKAIFIGSISEDGLTVVKCLTVANSAKEFSLRQTKSIIFSSEDKLLSEQIAQFFKQMGYRHEPIILALSSASVSCRYLKIPSFDKREIEKIACLQAAHYLPYPNSELITAYEIVETDKTGYSYINLAMAQRSQIERYLKILKGLRPKKLSIFLNAYGICNLYKLLRPRDSLTVALLDIGAAQVEMTVVHHRKVVFSRAFKFERKNSGWENLLCEEINKSRQAYAQEVSPEEIAKIVIISINRAYQEIAQAISKELKITVEVLDCAKEIKLVKEAQELIRSSDSSFCGLIGVGLRNLEDSLMLLPKDIKEEAKNITLNKQRLRRIALVLGACLIFALAAVKNLDNKSRYLQQLKIETDKISQDALPLEKMEKRMRALEKRLRQVPSSLDILYELHRIMPAQATLVNFTYNENGEIVLRGQTTSLNSVFEFVSQLEGSSVFKDFNTKVGYATKKNTESGELIDFEISCQRKK